MKLFRPMQISWVKITISKPQFGIYILQNVKAILIDVNSFLIFFEKFTYSK